MAGRPNGGGGGIQVVRYGGSASLTPSVRPGASTQQQQRQSLSPAVALDRAKSAYESVTRRAASRTELAALTAALSAVGVEASSAGAAGASGSGWRRGAGTASGAQPHEQQQQQRHTAHGQIQQERQYDSSQRLPRAPPRPVHRGANAWAPSFELRANEGQDGGGGGGGGSAEEERQVAHYGAKSKAVLNKLVPETFERLAQQILDMPLQRHAVLEKVISEIFDKALAEPYFCGVYADLCAAMNQVLPEIDDPVRDGKTSFRRMLLAKCRAEFVQRTVVEPANAQDKLAAEELRSKYRRRMLGNTIFVGELFKRHLLSEKIIHECTQMLLQEGEDEDSIETLAKLLAVGGSVIDRPEAKQYMDAYFAKIAEMSKSDNIRARFRFMLKDCMELRKNRWRPRRRQDKPSTLDEIHGRRGSLTSGASKSTLRFRPPEEPDAPPANSSGGGSGGNDKKQQNGDGEADDAHSGASSTAASTPSPMEREDAARALRGIIEDYMANPSADEMRRALQQSDFGSCSDAPAMAVEQSLMVALGSRESRRRPVMQALRALCGTSAESRELALNSDVAAAGFIDAAERVHELEGELDLPLAAVVLGECAAYALVEGVIDGARWHKFIRDVLAAAPSSRRRALLQSLLGALRASVTAANGESPSQRVVSLLGTDLLSEVLRGHGHHADIEAMQAFLIENDLAALMPRVAVRQALLERLPPQSAAAAAAAWIRDELADKRASRRALLAHCRLISEVLALDYCVPERPSSSSSSAGASAASSPEQETGREFLRRLHAVVPLLKIVSGGAAEDDGEAETRGGASGAEDEQRQVNVAFAVQRACYELDFPPDLMNGAFQALYEHDVVSEEAFERWREDTADETPGKTRALFQVNAFLTWLREAEEEEDEDEDDE